MKLRDDAVVPFLLVRWLIVATIFDAFSVQPFSSLCPFLTVEAHVRWVDPTPRPSNSIKSYPCGAGSTFGVGPVTTLRVGRNEVVFDEFICHKGDMFRIALSMGNDDNYDDHVLLDRLPHNDQCSFSSSSNLMAVNITVPNVDCVKNECSLQVIQVMSSKFAGSTCSNPSGIATSCGQSGRMYYSCARVRIAGTASTVPKVFNDYYKSKSPAPYVWPLATQWCQDMDKGYWRVCDVKETPQATFSASSGGSSIGACFSGDTVVETKGKGIIPMKQLRVGDSVKVAPADDDDTNNDDDYEEEKSKFEKVYSFGHYDAQSWFEFVVINDDVEISPNHLIAVDGKGYVPASTVQIGDRLLSGQTHGDLVEVTSITTRTSKGMFAPFTPSGRLIVQNVRVSSYVSLQRDESVLKLGGSGNGISTGLTFHWLAHVFECPHRLVCYHFGSCPYETYSEDDSMSVMWVDVPWKVATWLMHQNILLQLLVLVPWVVVFGVMAVIEFMLVRVGIFVF